jgi:hypothetical protein
MSVFNTFKTIKAKVEHLLTTQPHLRDDDAKLIATFQYLEIGVEKMESITALDLLTMFSKNQVTNGSSIDRVRRSLQEHNIHLRGINYIERHKEASDVKSNIRNL